MAQATTHQYPLPSMTDHESIADALYRAAISTDHHDSALFDSAWCLEENEDKVSMEIHHNDGTKPPTIMTGLSSIRKNVFDRVGPMDTTHNIGMVRVFHISGSNEATLTATSTAVHAIRGTGRDPKGKKYTVGGEYSVDLVRDDREKIWRIRKVVLRVVWTDGDAEVMGGPPPKPSSE